MYPNLFFTNTPFNNVFFQETIEMKKDVKDTTPAAADV